MQKFHEKQKQSDEWRMMPAFGRSFQEWNEVAIGDAVDEMCAYIDIYQADYQVLRKDQDDDSKEVYFC